MLFGKINFKKSLNYFFVFGTPIVNGPMWDFFHTLHFSLNNFLSRSHQGIYFPSFRKVINIFEIFSIFFSISLSNGLILISHYDMKMLVDHFSECVDKHAFHSYGDFISQHGGKFLTWLYREILYISFLGVCLEIVWFV